MNNAARSSRLVVAIALLLPLMLPLTACSWLGAVPGVNRIVGEEGVFRDRQGEYLLASTIPRTRIPEGMDSFIIDDLLVVPEISAAEPQSFIDPPRPQSLPGRSDRGVVIQRMDDASWIVVDVSPGQVWPRIRDFWRQAGIEVVAENPVAGQMETGWFIRNGEVLNRDKIRVSVETGFQDNSAEIRLLQQSALQAIPAVEQVSWPQASMDSQVEFDMLEALSGYLADVADLYQASSISFLAGNISSQGKATLGSADDGRELLYLQAGFNRSWAAVSRTMNRSGVEIVSQDASQGLLEVRYTPGLDALVEEESPGLFTRVFTLNGLLGGGGDLQTYQLQVRLRSSGTTVEVDVSAPEDNPDGAEEAGQALLRLIHSTIA